MVNSRRETAEGSSWNGIMHYIHYSRLVVERLREQARARRILFVFLLFALLMVFFNIFISRAIGFPAGKNLPSNFADLPATK